MGDRQEKLLALLNLTDARLTSGTLAYPSHNNVSSSKFKDEIKRVYFALGGIMSDFPLNLTKWDIEADGIAVELDEDLHFNRYRGLTLQSLIYRSLPHFPHSEYICYCSDHESDCLSAGSYGRKWTNKSCESQFGKAATEGDLSGNGSPRWKQRAFYDFVKDLTPSVLGIQLTRVSIWDSLKIGDRTVTVSTALYQHDPEVAGAFLDLIKKRASTNQGKDNMAHITLHEAMRIVLQDSPDRTASTEYISNEIIRRKLYTQKDGGSVFPDQIFLRARKYPKLFDLVGRTTVKLK